MRNYGWTVTFMARFWRRLGILVLAAGALTWGAGLLRDSKALEKNLVRLHVVANSDSQEDQDLKLQVRDAIVQQLNGVMGELDSAQAAKAFLTEHLGELQETANRVLQEAGSHLKAQVSLALEEFPTRVYDTFQLPAGLYEALRVTIRGRGEAQLVVRGLSHPVCSRLFRGSGAAMRPQLSASCRDPHPRGGGYELLPASWTGWGRSKTKLHS
ncbi:MAG: stage II sporulation protein R [Oscillospiraceae bacterium]